MQRVKNVLPKRLLSINYDGGLFLQIHEDLNCRPLYMEVTIIKKLTTENPNNRGVE